MKKNPVLSLNKNLGIPFSQILIIVYTFILEVRIMKLNIKKGL